MTELAAVGEELARAGLPAAADRRLARDRRQRARPARLAGAEGALAARASAAATAKIAFAVTEPDAGHEHAQPLHARRRATDGGYVLSGRRCSSPASRTPTRSSSSPAPASDEQTGRGLLSLFIVDVDAPGLERTVDPDRDARRRQAVARSSSTTSRCRPTAWWATRTRACGRLRRPQPGADHGRRAGARRRPAARWPRRRSTRASAWSGACRSARTRACPIRWPRPRSSSSWRALMTRKACALYDAGARARARRRTWRSTPRPRPAIHCVDHAIQTHGGNGVALEYGLSEMWWGVRTRGSRRSRAR